MPRRDPFEKHFVAMSGFLAFVPGHLPMVTLDWWDNWLSMLTGWKRNLDCAIQQGV